MALISTCCNERLKLAGDGGFVLSVCSKCGKEHRRMRSSELMKKIEEFVNTPDEPESDLIEEIEEAQVRAGEQAVMNRIRWKGVL